MIGVIKFQQQILRNKSVNWQNNLNFRSLGDGRDYFCWGAVANSMQANPNCLSPGNTLSN